MNLLEIMFIFGLGLVLGSLSTTVELTVGCNLAVGRLFGLGLVVVATIVYLLK